MVTTEAALKKGFQGNWRDFRNSSPKQRAYLDACFGVGHYKQAGAIKKRFVLGGGAGYGGKSFAIRTGIYECARRLVQAGVTTPKQLVCCITETDLEERHIKEILECQDIYPHDGPDKERRGEDIGLLNVGDLVREGKAQVWTFIFHDRSLGKVYFRHAKNVDRRRGVQYDAIWVDEITQFEWEEFKALDYMLRSAKNPPFLLFAVVTNPDGPGNWWVRKYFVPQYQDFSDVKKLKKSQFYFVPFRATDNPTFNEDVAATLQSDSDYLVKSRWLGEWDILTGTRFKFFESVHTFGWRDFLRHYLGAEAEALIPDERVRIESIKLLFDDSLFAHYGSFDYGLAESDFHIHAVDTQRTVWTWFERSMTNTILKHQASTILSDIKDIKIRRIYADPALKARDDATGLARNEQFRRLGLKLRMAYNDREPGWTVMDSFLDYAEDVKPRWRVHKSCRRMVFGMKNAPRDSKKPDDIDTTWPHDHAPDSGRYFFYSHFGTPNARNNQIEEHEQSKYGTAVQLIGLEEAC